MDKDEYLAQKTSEIESNSKFVSRAFGAGTAATICTITALTNEYPLGSALSTLLTGATGATLAAPLVAFVSGLDCKLQLKPFVTGAIGGLALTFGTAVYDHYNPTETQQQNNAIAPITTQHHIKNP